MTETASEPREGRPFRLSRLSVLTGVGSLAAAAGSRWMVGGEKPTLLLAGAGETAFVVAALVGVYAAWLGTHPDRSFLWSGIGVLLLPSVGNLYDSIGPPVAVVGDHLLLVGAVGFPVAVVFWLVTVGRLVTATE